MSNGPTTSPDGVDINGREPHRKTSDAAAECHLRLAVADETDVSRGAAHVERNEIPAAGPGAGGRGADDARSWARQRGADRHLAGPTNRHQPAGCLANTSAGPGGGGRGR